MKPKLLTQSGTFGNSLPRLGPWPDYGPMPDDSDPKPPRPEKESKPIMTVVIGFSSKQGIVLASDSQYSYSPSTAKVCGAQKIFIVEYKDGQALIALAGDVESASRTIAIVKELTAKVSLTSQNTLAKLLKESIKRVRLEIFEDYPAASVAEKKALLAGSNYQLMLAHFFKGKPLIFVGNLSSGFVVEQNLPICALGCGANLARAVLSEFQTDKMTVGVGLITAIHAIERVKEYDWACGGPTNAGYLISMRSIPDTDSGVIRPKQESGYLSVCEAVLLDSEEIQNRVEKIGALNRKIGKLRAKTLMKLVHGTAKHFPLKKIKS